jgi:DNA-binding LacI/PurR family transcriptional regulator
MEDLARAAGVSPATVSRVFNPAMAALVRPATRNRILQLAARLRYTPNRLASALSSGQTRSVGLVFPHTTHFTESTFDVNVLLHTVAALQPAGFDLKVHFLPPPPQVIDPLALAAHLSVDGLIFAGIPRAYRLGRVARTSAVRLVLLSSYKVAGVASVDADNIAAGRTAAQHLITHGHTRLGMLTGPPDSQNALDRAAGYRAAIRAAGLPLQDAWFVASAYGSEDGAAAARELLAHQPRPTALFCASDEIALGALRCVRDLGLACPRDISLIGFDDAQATAHTTPPLTTFAQAFDELAPAAVRLLLQQFSGSFAHPRRRFPAALIARASVAPPPPHARRRHAAVVNNV